MKLGKRIESGTESAFDGEGGNTSDNEVQIERTLLVSVVFSAVDHVEAIGNQP